MKLSHLQQLLPYFKKFKKIAAIHRVADTVLKVVFDKDETIYFDMTRSNSTIFKTDEYPRSKIYNAPFDVMVAKYFNRSNIVDVELLNNDKILRFTTTLSLAYKEQKNYLQFEFTGKYTNIILLDENEIVLEALRHIDLFSSFREVQVGVKLQNIPPAPFKAKEYPIENIEEFLYQTYQKQESQKLQSIKNQKLRFLQKKIDKLKKTLEKLDDEEKLQEEALKFEHYGNLALANIYKLKPYQSKIVLDDYDGTQKEIVLEKKFGNVADIAQHFFKKAKKAKQRAKNLYKERESLSSKIRYLELFYNTVQEVKSLAKLSLLFPKEQKSKKKEQDDSIETFFIEGYKVQLGKNQKGNIALLKSAKARDIWFHLRDIPSTHVIIKTDKQNVPKNVLESVARLCVDFSTTQKDRFEVDYTQRRFVNVQEGANVFYTHYSTITVDNRE